MDIFISNINPVLLTKQSLKCKLVKDESELRISRWIKPAASTQPKASKRNTSQLPLLLPMNGPQRTYRTLKDHEVLLENQKYSPGPPVPPPLLPSGRSSAAVFIPIPLLSHPMLCAAQLQDTTCSHSVAVGFCNLPHVSHSSWKGFAHSSVKAVPSAF